MRMLRNALVALTATAALAQVSTTANADGYRGGPGHVNWSGFYVGAHVGGAWSDTDWRSITASTFDLSQSASSVIGGAQAGFQHQFGNVVAGIEVSYSGINLDDSTIGFGVERYSSSTDKLVLVTGRLGLAWDRSLAYVKGGYASANTEFEIFHVGLGQHAISRGWDDGWTVGAGWEYAIGPMVSLGLEYNFVHIDIDDRTMRIGPQGCGAPCTITRAESDIQSVLLRLNFKFNRDREPDRLK
jgi:outer membrane immunogenic protein